MKKSIQLGIASVALAAAIAGCGSKAGKSVATINGEPITYDDFYYSLSMKPTVRIMTNQGPTEARVAERLDFQALQEAILRKITMQLAADEKVKPTDDEIVKEIEFRKSLNGNYMNQMTKNGYDVPHVKQIVALEMARERLLTKGVTVTKEEAEKYVKDNPSKFMEPATIDLRFILLSGQEPKSVIDKNKAQVAKDLVSGRGFAEVASTYSAIKDNANMYPGRVVDGLPKPIRDKVQNLNVGQHTDWIATNDGPVMFEVVQKAPAKKVDMNPSRIEGVRRSLALQRGQQGNDLAERIIKKLKESQKEIKVEDKALKELWSRSFEEFLKTQKDSATTSAKPADASPAAK